jgi:hypothetical protein
MHVTGTDSPITTSNEIIVDGIRYVSAGELAIAHGYVRDWVARLARQGTIRGRRLGGIWYVDEQSFAAYRRRINVASEQSAGSASQFAAETNGKDHAHIESAQSATRRAFLSRAVTARAPQSLHEHVSQLQTRSARKATLTAAIVTATLALVFTVGASALIAPDAMRITSVHAQSELAAAANPGGFLAAFSRAADLARSLATRVDDFIFGIALPGATLTYHAPAVVSGNIIQTSAPPARVATATSTTTAALLPSSRTIVEQRIIEQPPTPSSVPLASANLVTQDQLNTGLSQLENSLRDLVFQNMSAPNSLPASGGYTNEIAATQQINNLSNVTISHATVSGVSGLAPSDIPALPYLPLSGGTLTGSLNVPSLNASSTTVDAFIVTNATSTDLFSVLGTFTTGVIGNLTATIANITDLTATNLVATNATTTNATSTNLFASTLAATNGTLVNATTTNFFSTTASSTNLFASSASFGNLLMLSSTTLQNFTGVNATTTNFAVLGETDLSTTTIAGGLTLSGSPTSQSLTTGGDATIGGNLTVNGDTITLGTSTSNSLVINSSIRSDLTPDKNKTYDLGSPSFFWRNGYIDTLTVNNISAASTSIGGTASKTFTLDSGNNTSDADNMSLIFFRGTVVPNALLSWNAAGNAKRFEFNQPLYIQNQSGSTTIPTLSLQGLSGQTANIFQVASSSGALLFHIAADGSTNIGGSLTVNGPLTTTQQASTTLFSSLGPAYFGSTATTTIDSAGNVAVAGTLNVTGSTQLASLTASGNTTLANATTTNLFSTTASSTNLFSQTASLGSLSLGSALTVGSGGTGVATLTGLVKGNGTSAFTAAVAGTDYENPLTFGSGLARSVNTVTLDTSGSWSGTLGGYTPAQLIAAGFSTTSAAYWKTQNNFFATSSSDYWLTTKSTSNLAEGSNLYFTNNRVASVIAGTTTDALAQGTTNKYYSTLLFASDLSGTTTDSLHEGSTNQYFTNNRVASVISGTTTNALAEGSTNKYYTDARVDNRINATSTIGTLTSAPHLATVSTALTGFLKATAGVLTTSAINLASDVTGTLPISYGGTNATSFTAGQLVSFDGARFVSTSTIGTNLLTGSLGTINGSSLSAGGTITITAASSTLLANNNTFSGANTFSNATTTNLFSTTASSTNLFAQTASLGSLTANSLVLGGALPVSSGGTGAGTFSYGLLLSPGGTGALTNISTSSLGLLTTNVAEGTNLYYTANRVAGVIAGTTTSAIAEGTNLYFTNNRVATVIAGTTTDALAQGSTNKYWSNTLFDNRLSATTTLPNLTILGNLATVGTIQSGTWQSTAIANTYGGTGQNSSSWNGLAAVNAGVWSALASTSLNASITGSAGSVANAVTFNNSGSGAGSGQTYNGSSATTISYNTIGAQPAGTYLTALGNYATTTGTAISVSTSTLSWNGLTLGNTFTVSANGILVTPTVSGTINNAGLAHSTIVVNGSTLTLGDSGDTITAASSTLLSNNNTWSGTNNFGTIGAGTWNGTAIGSQFGGTGQNFSSSNGLAAINSGVFSAISTSTLNIGGNAQTATTLQTARTINGVSFDGSTNITITAASSTLLANSNTFSGNNTFNGLSTLSNASTTLLSVASKAYFGGTAITTIDSAGNVVIPSTASLTVANLSGAVSASAGVLSAGTLSIANGGTNATSFASGQPLAFDGTRFVSTSTLSVVYGGTGATSLTGLLQGNGSSALTAVGGSAGQFPYFNGASTLGATSSIFLATSGNVGIGTTTPDAALSVNGTYVSSLAPGGIHTRSTIPGISFEDTTQSGNHRNFSIMNEYQSAGGLNFNYSASAGSLPNSTAMTIDGTTGNVGIGTASPSSVLDVVGVIRSTSVTGAPTSGVGTELLYNAGTAEAVVQGYNRTGSAYTLLDLYGSTVTTHNMSDQRLKTNITDLTDTQGGLSAIEQLRPVTFNWKDAQLNAQKGQQIGLIAQEVQQVFPGLVTTAPATTTITLADGTTQTIQNPLTLNYEGLVVPLVKAVQDIANITSTFQQNLIAWVGNASNGIGDFFAKVGHFDEVHTNSKLCVGSTCVTPAQFQAMVAATNASQSGSSPTTPSSSTQGNDASTTPSSPPVIPINGDNPATIHVGDTYTDLGATITGPQADLNLGIKTFLNGTLTSNIVIDTSSVATDTIDYVATDSTDLTATSSRTIIIEASPSIIPTLDASTTASTSSQLQ